MIETAKNCNLERHVGFCPLYNFAMRKILLRRLGYLGLTIITFIVVNWFNEIAFIQFEQSTGINWVFLPAGVRLLATLLFGFTGFAGLLLVSIYLNFNHFVFQDDVRALSGAVAAAIGPYVAYLFAKHWFYLGPRLKNLTARRLLFTGVLSGIMSPACHHAFIWVATGLMDWTSLIAMICGDITGILIVLYISKGLITLTDPRNVDSNPY